MVTRKKTVYKKNAMSMTPLCKIGANGYLVIDCYWDKGKSESTHENSTRHEKDSGEKPQTSGHPSHTKTAIAATPGIVCTRVYSVQNI